jgi:hypothetical protein
MRIVWILAGLALVVATTGAFAQNDGTVSWVIDSPDDPEGDDFQAFANTDPALADIIWNTSVEVTGNNKGLGFSVLDLDILDSGGANVGTVSSTASLLKVFNVGGAGKAFATDVVPVGGPGMTGPSSGGAILAGKLTGFGVSYAAGWNYNNSAWGVGMASRGSFLLNDVSTGYRMFKGTIDLSALADGTYTIRISPQEQKLLRSDVTLDGVVTEDPVLFSAASSDVSGEDLVIHIFPEPASLLLLAGGGLLLRRRRR